MIDVKRTRKSKVRALTVAVTACMLAGCSWLSNSSLQPSIGSSESQNSTIPSPQASLSPLEGSETNSSLVTSSSDTSVDVGVDAMVCHVTQRSKDRMNLGDGGIAIQGLSSIVQNIPVSELNAIQEILCWTVAKNVSKDGDLMVIDAHIRDGSYSQTYSDDAQEVYSTRFLVDLPSLKQSYLIADDWSPLPPQQSGLTDYTLVVNCPKPEELIYGSFDNCWNSYDE